MEDTHNIDLPDGRMTPAIYCGKGKGFRLSIRGIAAIWVAESLVLTIPEDSARPHWIRSSFDLGLLLYPAVI